MKRLVLFAEGVGESDAAPRLVERLLTEYVAWDAVFLDKNVFRVGHVNRLARKGYTEWKRLLKASLKRSNVGAVLLLLDGDAGQVDKKPFCAADVAKDLAMAAASEGAGATFTVAVVFACQEYESWLIAGVESFAGQKLPDGRLAAPLGVRPPEGDLDQAPRDAKGWLNGVVEDGYKPTRDQAALTSMVDLDLVRSRGQRSFVRMESGVQEIVTALRTGNHIASPGSPS